MAERDLRNRGREPFGPLQPGLWGKLMRGCQWGLTIITVICMWPGVMLIFTAAMDLITEGMPEGNTLLIRATWCLWGLLLVLTALRLSGYGYRWWGFFPNALAWAALASQSYPGAWDNVGQCIVQLMAAVMAAQCLLHGLWSLSERMLQAKRDKGECV